MVRLTDHPNMTIAVYHGHKATTHNLHSLEDYLQSLVNGEKKSVRLHAKVNHIFSKALQI